MIDVVVLLLFMEEFLVAPKNILFEDWLADTLV